MIDLVGDDCISWIDGVEFAMEQLGWLVKFNVYLRSTAHSNRLPPS